jgi:hypothetical protein
MEPAWWAELDTSVPDKIARVEAMFNGGKCGICRTIWRLHGINPYGKRDKPEYRMPRSHISHNMTEQHLINRAVLSARMRHFGHVRGVTDKRAWYEVSLAHPDLLCTETTLCAPDMLEAAPPFNRQWRIIVTPALMVRFAHKSINAQALLNIVNARTRHREDVKMRSGNTTWTSTRNKRDLSESQVRNLITNIINMRSDEIETMVNLSIAANMHLYQA